MYFSVGLMGLWPLSLYTPLQGFYCEAQREAVEPPDKGTNGQQQKIINLFVLGKG